MAYINEKYVPPDKTTELEQKQLDWKKLLLGLRKPPGETQSYRRRSQIINQGGVDATNYESRKKLAAQAAWMERQQRNMNNMTARGINVSTGPGSQSQNSQYNGNIPNIAGGGSFEKFVNAITGKESGGNYNARNRDSGAMGRYQIMPGNIAGSRKGWDYEALGRDISTSQFMANPRLQDAIARYKLQQYFNKWGPRGAAIAWYAGPRAVNRVNLNKSQGKYPTINQYANDILRRMGL
jgi:hypothetical protein